MPNSGKGLKQADPDTCVKPNPLLTPDLQAISCRTYAEWLARLGNVQDDTSPNQFTNLNLPPSEDLVIDSKNTLKTYKQAVNPSNRKGLVFMFHGLNSRVGHGSHIAKFLANEGYEVVGFDHRGLGTSQKTSTVEGVNFSSHIQDSTTFINKIKAQYPTSTKYYALGLSLGGLTSFHLASNFRAVILMAPAIQKIQQLPSNLTDYERLVTANIGARSLLSTDPDKYHTQPPLYLPIARQYISLLMGQMQLGPDVPGNSFHNYKNFTTPFMVANGGSDRLVDPRVGFDLLNTSSLSSSQKQIYFQDDMWHNVWFDKRILSGIMPKALKFIQRF